MSIVPFGSLVSFGNIIFPNVSSPIQEFDLEALVGFDNVANSDFPFDMGGIGAVPLKDPHATWVYLIIAAYGSSDPYTDVEEQFGTIYTGLRFVGGDGTAGTRATLTVQRASKLTTLSCRARFLKTTLSLQAGINTEYYLMPMSFELLSEWV